MTIFAANITCILEEKYYLFSNTVVISSSLNSEAIEKQNKIITFHDGVYV